MSLTHTDPPGTDGAMTRGSVAARSALGEAARACAGWDVDEIHGWSMAERRGTLAEVDRLIAALGVAKARLLSVEEASGDWALSGAKDVAAWRAQSTRAGFGAAKGELELASAVGEMPRLGDAVADGSMTLQHAQAVAREFNGASEAQRDVLLHDPEVQDRVFKNALRTDAGRFGKSMKLTMAEIDPAKFQRDHDAVHERRFARIRNQAGGVHFEAFLNTFDGRKLSEALGASAARPGADDDRTNDQRRADALVAIADAILAYGDAGAAMAEGPGTESGGADGRATDSAVSEPAPRALPGANRPHLTILMSAAEMAGWRARGEFPGAVFDDDTPVPPDALDALLCDASVMRLVLDAQARPEETGQNVRTFSGTARTILIARDRGCAWPGCGLSARYTEGHHVKWWSHGGKTTTDNGILLCSRHHHMIHEGKMLIIPVAGGFRFDKPDGTVHGTHTFRPARTGPAPGPPESRTGPAPGPPESRTGPPSDTGPVPTAYRR